MQAITVDHARGLLAGSASVFDAALEVGLSGGSRLHDLFVSHEAMTPGDYKRRGEGLEMAYGFHACPFGEALLIATDRGVAGLAFVDEDKGQTRQDALADMMQRWPKARYVAAPEKTAPHARQIFASEWRRDQPVRLVMIGTDFDIRVWETLLKIPMGRAVSYTDIARHIGAPSASRAVGSAVGRNPISFVVPCHRVLRGDGSLGGYHWGLTRKRALIGWETGRVPRRGRERGRCRDPGPSCPCPDREIRLIRHPRSEFRDLKDTSLAVIENPLTRSPSDGADFAVTR